MANSLHRGSSKAPISFLKLSTLVLLLSLVSFSQSEIVVGVLTLFTKPISKLIKKKITHLSRSKQSKIKRLIKKSTYISDNYTRWLKSVGIRSVALDISRSTKHLLRQMNQVDGLLLTGGKEGFYKDVVIGKDAFHPHNTILETIPTIYLNKVNAMIKRAKYINNHRKNFPVWATCLGFEALLVVDSNFTLSRHVVNNKIKRGAPIKIQTSKCNVMNFFTPREKHIIENKKTFYFNHKYGIYASDLKRNRYLRHRVHLVASLKKKNKKLVAIFEYKNYPFLGSQFHPEKFANVDKTSSSHPNYARIRINQKLALLFKRFIVRGLSHGRGRRFRRYRFRTSARKVLALPAIGNYKDITVYKGVHSA